MLSGSKEKTNSDLVTRGEQKINHPIPINLNAKPTRKLMFKAGKKTHSSLAIHNKIPSLCIVTSILIVTLPLQVTATNYYVDSQGGAGDVKTGGNWQCSNNVLLGKCVGWTDANKITENPQFVNGGNTDSGWVTAVRNYTLKATSPARDKGITIANNGGKDYAGNPIPFNSVCDIGAMEYTDVQAIRMPEFKSATFFRQNSFSTDAATHYFTLSGKRLQNNLRSFKLLGNGFIIKQESFSDGKVKLSRVGKY
jgi:hypothetical protein